MRAIPLRATLCHCAQVGHAAEGMLAIVNSTIIIRTLTLLTLPPDICTLARCAAGALVFAAGVLAPFHAARAQDDDPAIPHSETHAADVRASFAAGAWFARLRGTTELRAGASPASLDLDLDLNLSGGKATPNGEFDLHVNQWAFRLTMCDFSTSGQTETPASFTFGDLSVRRGERIRSAIDFSSAAFEAAYLFTAVEGKRGCLRTGPLIGLRHIDLDFSLETAGPGRPAEERSPDAIAPFAGGRLEIDVFDSLWIEGSGGLGVALPDGGVCWHLSAGLAWRPHPNVGVSFGYRLIDATLEDEDDYVFDGQLAGLFAGASFAF